MPPCVRKGEKTDVRESTLTAGRVMDAGETCMEKLRLHSLSLVKPLTLFSTSNFKDQWPGSDSNTNETQDH